MVLVGTMRSPQATVVVGCGLCMGMAVGYRFGDWHAAV